MDTRCRCFGHHIALVAVIELPVDVGVRLEVARVDRACRDREGADGDGKHTTSWITVAGCNTVLNSTVYRSDVVAMNVDSHDRRICSIQLNERHTLTIWDDILFSEPWCEIATVYGRTSAF